MNGPGEVMKTDASEYKDPRYSRTLEISEEQYRKLEAFGSHPEKFGFDLQYKDVRNNCVDFTWEALNHAGIERKKSIDLNMLGGGIGQLLPDARIPLGGKGQGKDGYRPLRNIHGVDSIEPPFPGSELNRKKTNPMPEQSLQQRILSDAEGMYERNGEYRASHSNDPLLSQINHGVAQLNAERFRNFDGATTEELGAAWQEVRALAAGTAQQPGALRADPLQPGGADYALHQQIRAGVAALDAQHGRAPDAVSDRMTASLLVLAKENDPSRVDQVVLSAATGHQPAGHTVFLVKGDLSSPPFALATMTTDRAVATPVEVSMQRYQQMNQEAQQQTAARQVEQQAQDGRVQGMGIG